MKNKKALLSFWDNFNTELYYKYLKLKTERNENNKRP
jgi:hypothetical protein